MQDHGSRVSEQAWSYLDFVLEIESLETKGKYRVDVHCPIGDHVATMHLPFSDEQLNQRVATLKKALLPTAEMRSNRLELKKQHEAVKELGKALFDALFTPAVSRCYGASREKAACVGRGLRLQLRIEPPELVRVPWEFLWDSWEKEYVALGTPIVRYLKAPKPVQLLSVDPPLRILGMTASPREEDQDPESKQLEQEREYAQREKQLVKNAMKVSEDAGRVKLHWLEGQTWHDLRSAMQPSGGGPWHVFHFIGHGGFIESYEEAFLKLADEKGVTYALDAERLVRLLAGHTSLRLVFLSCCEGARGSENDTFSSTAATLIEQGIPAVVAMQYEVTSPAAVQFSSTFYRRLADRYPVDAAVTEARKEVAHAEYDTLEWGTPTLYMRSPDGKLFDIKYVQPLWKPQRPVPIPPAAQPMAARVRRPLEGKGWYIWQVKLCEEGEPNAIAAKAQQAGLSHVLIKVADGPSEYRYNVIMTGDRVGPIVSALRGIPDFQVWGWQYIYGEEPEAEARIAVDLVQQYGLDGFVIHAERVFKRDEVKPSAPRYCQALRQNLEDAGLEDLPIALSSYRYPITHSDFPWEPFLEVCTIMMPQVYWVTKGIPDPVGNLESCLRQYEQLGWTGPIIPTGAAYDEKLGWGEDKWLWSTGADEIRAFLPAVKAKGLPAVNFWSWQGAGDERWQAVAEFQWD